MENLAISRLFKGIMLLNILIKISLTCLLIECS